MLQSPHLPFAHFPHHSNSARAFQCIHLKQVWFPDLHLSVASSTTNQEPLHKEVNATIANFLLNTVIPHTIQIATTEWVCKVIFPDKNLPVPFNDVLLDNIPECWDKSAQRFSNFPDTMGEQVIQNWLNHLLHLLHM